MSGYDSLADELERIADEVASGSTGFPANVQEGMQLARRADPDAAEQLQQLLFVDATRAQMAGVLKGAATAARLLGPMGNQDSAPHTQVNVSTSANAMAIATATAENAVMSNLRLLATWPGIPDEAAEEIRGMEEAVANKDKPGLMQRAATAATLLGAFPDLATAVMDAATHASQLF